MPGDYAKERTAVPADDRPVPRHHIISVTRRLNSAHVLCQPAAEWREALGLHPIDALTAAGEGLQQVGRLEQLQMLHHRRARHGQGARQLARAHRRARKSLEDHHAQRVTEQYEQSQHFAQRGAASVRLGLVVICHASLTHLTGITGVVLLLQVSWEMFP
jgi:hypothetical protein